MSSFDVIVIGGGIAGASVGYELSAHARVLLVEAEGTAGYHATGRSAALFSEIYGNRTVRALSRASRPFFAAPLEEFRRPLLTPRGSLFVATSQTIRHLDEMCAEEDIAGNTRRLSTAQAIAMVPILKPSSAVAALYEQGSQDIDVAGLHQGYLRGLTARSGQILTRSVVKRIDHHHGAWQLIAGEHTFRSTRIVNAAGAWADQIATLAGAKPIGLMPMRRTAVIIDAPPVRDFERWPLVIAADESFYFKPESGRLLLSPADETPTVPCDTQPDEMDVAIAVDRFEHATGQTVRRIVRKWAGLRTFSPSRTPVVGEDRGHPGLFWYAGQGGYGIQTAPAAARWLAAIVLGRPVPADILIAGVSEVELTRSIAREEQLH